VSILLIASRGSCELAFLGYEGNKKAPKAWQRHEKGREGLSAIRLWWQIRGWTIQGSECPA